MNEICTQWVHIHPQSPLKFQVAAIEDMSELILSFSGERDELQRPLLEAFRILEASPKEIDLFNNFILKIDPPTIGSYLHMSDSGGMDLGWSIESKIPTSYIFDFEKNSKVFSDLRRYMLERGIDHATYCSRDIGPIPPNGTTIVFSSPGKDLFEQAESIKDLFGLLKMETFPDWIWLLLFSCEEKTFQTKVSLTPKECILISVSCQMTLTVVTELAKRGNLTRKFLNGLDQGANGIEFQMLRREAAYHVYQENLRIM